MSKNYPVFRKRCIDGKKMVSAINGSLGQLSWLSNEKAKCLPLLHVQQILHSATGWNAFLRRDNAARNAKAAVSLSVAILSTANTALDAKMPWSPEEMTLRHLLPLLGVS